MLHMFTHGIYALLFWHYFIFVFCFVSDAKQEVIKLMCQNFNNIILFACGEQNLKLILQLKQLIAKGLEGYN